MENRGDGSDRRATGADEWSELFCIKPSCHGSRWYVRPDHRGLSMWLISEGPYEAPWSLAAAAPVCPLCGGALAGHVEGVGPIEAEARAPILRFLRSLERAA